MIKHSVVIVGGGPTGLTLAGELALAGVDVAIVERRPDQELAGSRAGGLHSRTIEMFDQRGIADRFLSAGTTAQVGGFAWMPLDISDFPTRHNYGLALWQNGIERVLADWVEEAGVPIYRNREVTGFSQDASGVDITLSDGETMRSSYLVGCDGARSLVRKVADIQFPGWDPSMSVLLAEAEFTGDPVLGLRRDALGLHSLSPTDDGPFRIMVSEQELGRKMDPSLADLSDALVTVYGSDFGIHSPTWITRFNDMARQAATYRTGRVFLAGDAAHIHGPMGGQGLNIGVQDALNLGWKLGQVVNGTSSEALLDSYHAERHPVAAAVLRNTMAQVALLRSDDQTNALREVFADFLKMDEPRKQLAGAMSGLTVQYDLGSGHPLLGRRMPDLDLMTGIGLIRVFTLLHTGRHVLINFGKPGGLDATPWSGRVRSIDATCSAAWELPILGHVATPAAVLIRPDGYVAWVGDGTDSGLHAALSTCVGPA